MTGEKVIIIDFGGGYAGFLARTIREKKVYSEIVPCSTPAEEIRQREGEALILCGGPGKVDDRIMTLLDPGILNLGVPVLAVGYGVKAVLKYLGGSVFDVISEMDKQMEIGINKSIWLNNRKGGQAAVEGGFQINRVPEGFKVITETLNGLPVVYASEDDSTWISLLYPGEAGKAGELLDHFLFKVAGLKDSWNPASFVTRSTETLQKLIPAPFQAVCGLSGGIDSLVCALLVQRAIGDRLTCIFVDHGLMRQGEPEQVVENTRNRFNLKLIHVDAREGFLGRLKGVSDPEEKRKTIGNYFIQVFEEEAFRLDGVKYLVQGTIYPDIIESISPSGEIIKSHHNVGGLPEKMNLSVVEPVKELFKDEVRAVGRELGLSEEVLSRHPFPGPGLGVRVLGEITSEKLEIARKADYIVEDEIKKAGLYTDLWQAFAVLPDVKSVGVSGDRRTYAYPVIIRAVTSRDAMTARWYRFPYQVLDRLSRRMVEEVPGVNRVMYDITSKPPGTIEWE